MKIEDNFGQTLISILMLFIKEDMWLMLFINDNVVWNIMRILIFIDDKWSILKIWSFFNQNKYSYSSTTIIRMPLCLINMSNLEEFHSNIQEVLKNSICIKIEDE